MLRKTKLRRSNFLWSTNHKFGYNYILVTTKDDTDTEDNGDIFKEYNDDADTEDNGDKDDNDDIVKEDNDDADTEDNDDEDDNDDIIKEDNDDEDTELNLNLLWISGSIGVFAFLLILFGMMDCRRRMDFYSLKTTNPVDRLDYLCWCWINITSKHCVS